MLDDEKTINITVDTQVLKCDVMIQCIFPVPHIYSKVLSLCLFLHCSLSKQDVWVSAELPQAEQHKADDQIAGLWSAQFSQRCDRLSGI